MSDGESMAEPAASDLWPAFAALADEAFFERIGDDDAVRVTSRLWQLLGHADDPPPARHSTLVELLHPDDRARGAALLMRPGEPDVLLGRLRCHDGQYRWLRQRCREDRLPDGRHRVRGAFIDVDELERYRRADAGADRLRTLARASHELRTPLGSLLGLLGLAQGVAASEVQRRYLALASQTGQALVGVLDDVLDLARLDAGVQPPRLQWVDLDAVLSEALRSITPEMGWRDFAVVYDFDGDVTMAHTDGGKLRQIVVNLMGNAARLTDHGHIGLAVRTRWLGDGQAECRLRLEDTGPGIAPERLPRLFEPFALAGETRRRGGTGLGLSIVRALVDALGGQIRVESTPGQGTVFEIDLRLAALPDPPPPRNGPAPATWLVYPPPGAAGDWLARRVQRCGAPVRILPGIDAAIDPAAGAGPELLIVAAHAVWHDDDLMRLKAARPGARLVLVSRPDWQHPEREQQALDLGGLVLLVPVARRDLCALLGQPLAAPAPPAAAGPAPPPRLRGRVLLVEDDLTQVLVAEAMLRSLQLSVRSFGSAEEALAACAEAAPDLVLMDLQLPGIDGCEATRRLREAQARGALKRFPVLGFTADALPVVAPRCAQAGMDDVIGKPADLASLRAALQPWLARRSAAR